jgi:iron complex outermembrane receptor protein
MRLAALAVAAALAPVALAQSSEAVLIEATRFPEDSRRLPASVTVLHGEDIARSAARTLPELLAEQAGITMSDLFGNNAASTSVDLRGFGVTGTQNTLILLDGRRVTDIDLSGVQWAAIPLASIERIEILRGAGAVLYGDGATGGVVNIVTRSPLKQGRRAEAMARAASYDTLEGQLFHAMSNPHSDAIRALSSSPCSARRHRCRMSSGDNRRHSPFGWSTPACSACSTSWPCRNAVSRSCTRRLCSST